MGGDVQQRLIYFPPSFAFRPASAPPPVPISVELLPIEPLEEEPVPLLPEEPEPVVDDPLPAVPEEPVPEVEEPVLVELP